MAIPTPLQALAGSWSGTSVLHRPWLEGAEALSRSASRATVAAVANGTFLSIAYEWSLDGKRHEGLLLVGEEAAAGTVHAAWTDSWHLRDQLMRCTGERRDVGTDVFGTYVVPGHPDWGWRTVLSATGDAFELLMYNVTPDGEEALAVQCRYARDRQAPDPDPS